MHIYFMRAGPLKDNNNKNGPENGMHEKVMMMTRFYTFSRSLYTTMLAWPQK